MLSELEQKIACDGVDHVVAVAVGGKFHKIEKVPLIRYLYEAARRKANDEPLSYRAAKGLIERVKPGDNVLIVTGWYLPHFMSGESDGPPGAAGLARALDLGLKATPVLMTEPKLRPIVEASCRGAGLRVYDLEEAMKIPRRVTVWDKLHPYMSEEETDKIAAQILDEVKPSAVIAVEKGSRNEKGVYHSLWGLDISPLTAKIDRLVEMAKRRGIFTIGIGDGGNEIGMGNIKEEVKKYLPSGAKCYCPCGAGVAATTECDELIVAFVSNWGAYGIEAALALLLGRTDVMHSGEVEKSILEEAGRAGAIASPYGYSGTRVDQMPGEISIKIVELLNYLTYAYLVETEQRIWYQEENRLHGAKMKVWIEEEYRK